VTQRKGFFRKAMDAFIDAGSRRARKRADYFLATHLRGSGKGRDS
jgi:hypothetical protein